MNVLVTGASGFIGGYVVRELLANGHNTTGLARSAASVARLEALGMRVAVGDITDRRTLEAPLEHQEAVIHLAAVVGKNPGGWDHHESVGVGGTRHVIDVAVERGVRRLVHLSSCVVYKQPPPLTAVSEDSPLEDHVEEWNHYLRQKLVSEEVVWAARDKLEVSVVRPSAVIGPGDPNLIPYWRAINTSPLAAAADDGSRHFPVVVVEDLARGIVLSAIRPEAAGRAYNMASERPYTRSEVFDMVRRAGVELDSSSKSRSLVIGAFGVGVDLLERGLQPFGSLARGPRASLVRRLKNHAKRRPQADLVMDTSRARSDLGWRGSSDIERAVQRLAKWFEAGAPADGWP